VTGDGAATGAEGTGVAGDSGVTAAGSAAGGVAAGREGATGAVAGTAVGGVWTSTTGGGAPTTTSPITARRAPTSTVSPSGTSISVRMPAAGAGTSESTLSVETSKRGSSRLTWSPTAFIQRVIVPSVTVSPSCGIVTSANV
jgi:hypothetical protein